MNIFAPGIVWDPREPLPPEYSEPRPPATYVNFVTQEETQSRLLPPAVPGLEQLDRPIVGKRVPDLTVQEPGRNVLAPWSISLDVSILQDTANITTTQTFWNNSDSVIPQGAYTFPLPTGCTVAGFNCRIGTGKILNGVVKPKREARAAYRRLLSEGRSAGLLEQNTPEIFTTTLGNIPANTMLKVEVSIITLLKHHFACCKGTTTLTIPTCIASRYGSPEGFHESSSTDVAQGLSLNIEVLESENIRSVASKTHRVVVDRATNKRKAENWADLSGHKRVDATHTALVRLESGSAFLDMDFVLDIETESGGTSESPQAWLEEHSSIENQKALMLTLPQNFISQLQPVSERTEILFLADRSGSMEDKIEPLKSAMQFFLKGIPEGKKFNIWSFGSTYTAWCSQSVDYSEMSLGAALSYVSSNFRADMGGTELLPALIAMSKAIDISVPTDVIVLTDGEVWRLEQTLEFVRNSRSTSGGRLRYFSLGIGNAVSQALVEGIAKAGGGYAEIIPAASEGGWEDRLVSLAKAALDTKHIGPVHISFEGANDSANQDLNVTVAKQSPADIVDLNPFVNNRIWMLIEQPISPLTLQSVSIKALTWDGTEKHISVPVNQIRDERAIIHKLAARSLLEDLEFGRSHLHQSPDFQLQAHWEQQNSIREEAEQIAGKWSLASKWTSFFLAEHSFAPNGDESGDAFGWGVSEPSDAAGDDLLLPRYVTQCHAPASCLNSVPGEVQTANDDSLWAMGCYSSQEGLSDPFGGSPPGVLERSSDRFDLFPLCVGNSLEISGAVMRKRKQPRRAHVVHSIGDVRESSGNMTVDLNSNRARRNYIIELLRFQRFDGSFQFSTQAEVQATLGADIASALLDLMGEAVLDTVIYTSAVVILLERDFASHQALWELMRDKAFAYLQKHGEGGYDTAEVAEKLKGLGISLGNNPSQSSHQTTKPSPDDCSGGPSPRRVAVELAPDGETDKGHSEK